MSITATSVSAASGVFFFPSGESPECGLEIEMVDSVFDRATEDLPVLRLERFETLATVLESDPLLEPG